MKMAWVVFVVCGILAILITGLLGWVRVSDTKQLQESKPWVTHSRLMYFVSHGCNEYKEQYHVWPSSLDQLRRFGADLNERAKDMWGNDFIFVPYNDSLGYGQIISFGADGKPGGTNADADIEVRFPSDANSDWNRQAGAGLKRPKREPWISR